MHTSGSVTKIANVLLFTSEFCALLTSRLVIAAGMLLIGWVATGCP